MVLIHLFQEGYIGMKSHRGRRKRQDRKRRLVNYGIHLVYSEGKVTEPNYVNNIKRRIDINHKNSNNKIIIENAPHSDLSTIGLVNHAISDVSLRLKNKEKIEHVWIFFDKDDFEQTNFDAAHNRIINLNKSEYQNDDGDNTDENKVRWHSLWSNQCFELWVLLHFGYYQSSLHRDNYIDKINSHIPDNLYSKTMKNLYDILLEYGNLNSAIKNAKKLYNGNNIKNPSTGIYQLLEYFKLYLGYEN